MGCNSSKTNKGNVADRSFICFEVRLDASISETAQVAEGAEACSSPAEMAKDLVCAEQTNEAPNLGISFSCIEQGLKVEAIKEGGIVDKSNQLPEASKVFVGDVVMRVNGCTVDALKSEIKKACILVLDIKRTESEVVVAEPIDSTTPKVDKAAPDTTANILESVTADSEAKMPEATKTDATDLEATASEPKLPASETLDTEIPAVADPQVTELACVEKADVQAEAEVGNVGSAAKQELQTLPNVELAQMQLSDSCGDKEFIVESPADEAEPTDAPKCVFC